MQITSYLKTKTVQIAAWIGFLLAYLIASTVFSLAGDYTNDILKARHVLGIGFVLTAVALALIAWRYGQQLKKHNPRNIGRTKVTRKVIYQFLLILLFMMIFQMFWSWLISQHILVLPENQKAVASETVQMPLWNGIYAIVLAPIFEELIFRGIFMNYFFNKENRLNNILAIVISGLLFGFAHELQFDANWLMYSALGCFLSFTYMHFRDIRYSIALHFLNNLLSII